MATLRDHRAPLTYADCVDFPDDGRRHEIVGGEHLVTPSPSSRHQTTALRLAAALLYAIEPRGAGRVLAAPFDVILSDVDVVQPDILAIRADRAGIIHPHAVIGAPDLVVEVLSPSTAAVDRGVKSTAYEAHGVAEYWIVDPDRRTVEQHVRDEGSGRFRLVAAATDEIVAARLADVRIDLSRIWP